MGASNFSFKKYWGNPKMQMGTFFVILLLLIICYSNVRYRTGTYVQEYIFHSCNFGISNWIFFVFFFDTNILLVLCFTKYSIRMYVCTNKNLQMDQKRYGNKICITTENPTCTVQHLARFAREFFEDFAKEFSLARERLPGTYLVWY